MVPALDKREKEVFQYLQHTWDVDAAKDLIEAEPRETQPLPVAVWVKQFGMERPPEEGPYSFSLFGVRVDWKKIDSGAIDLAVPVIVVPWTVGEGDDEVTSPMLIDGWHRLALAGDQGVETLPAYVLTEEEAEQVHNNLLGGRG